MSEHDRFSESVGAYLVGALPERELGEFEAHVATCADCRAELEELQVAADALPDAAPQFAAPPELRDRIMAVVEREAELLQAAGPEADRPAPRRERRRIKWGFPGRLAIPALACAAAVGLGGGLVLSGGDSVRTYALHSVHGVSGQLRVSDGSAEIVAQHLPDPPTGRVYQVWLQRKGDAKPEPTSALFTATGDGRAAIDVPGSLDDVEQVMVTDEPQGGSQSPTGELLLSATPA